jgi:hypothetical protein
VDPRDWRNLVGRRVTASIPAGAALDASSLDRAATAAEETRAL